MTDKIVPQEQTTTDVLAWHFLRSNELANGDKRKVIVGETLTVSTPVVLCSSGLHASKRVIDALSYAPGAICCRVRLSGEIVEGDDKLAASERTVIAMIDATDVLRAFSRWCALEVAHLWDMPPIVRQYLETGDESIRAAARAAAWTAWDATWDAARAAAWDAARAAAWDAARAAARAAAWAAARAAKIEEFNIKLESMLLEAMGVTQ